MGDLIARCGYRCNLCPAYKGNIHSRGDRETTSDGWFRIFGFRIPPEKISCDSCLTPDYEKPELIDSGCPVRPCVVAKGLQNCAHCDGYPCDIFGQRAVDYNLIAKSSSEPISNVDYERFIKPYENRKLLDKIRSGIEKDSERAI